MVDLNPIILILTLNVNRLNIPIKRPILSDWIKKEKESSIGFIYKRNAWNIQKRLKVKRWKKLCNVKINLKSYYHYIIKRRFMESDEEKLTRVRGQGDEASRVSNLWSSLLLWGQLADAGEWGGKCRALEIGETSGGNIELKWWG